MQTAPSILHDLRDEDRALVPSVIRQHVDDASGLRRLRTALLRAPNVGLAELEELDERIAAHLDGIAVAGSRGRALVTEALARAAVGELFTATIRALEDREAPVLDRLLSIAAAAPEAEAGLLSAFGWVSAATLRGTTQGLLVSRFDYHRKVGLVACGMHGVNPGHALDRAFCDENPSIRRAAMRVAGRSGRRELLEACLRALGEDDRTSRLEAARAALLLGNRAEAIAVLEELALQGGADPRRRFALHLVLRAVPNSRARSILARLAKDGADAATLMQGVAVAGDPHYLPWLIDQAKALENARRAGEAISFITGVDVEASSLQQPAPTAARDGPSDDPSDDDVAIDPDRGLAWPDPAKLAAWWRANHAAFESGFRYFLGEVPRSSVCVRALMGRPQRQRAAAAEELCLLQPGTALFNVAAPAWRQRRLLTAMADKPEHAEVAARG